MLSSFARLDSRGRLSPHHFFVCFGEITDELTDIARIFSKVEGEEIGVREAQRCHSPELRHERVVSVSGVAEVVHPEEVVVGRVVDAVIAFESQAENGDADEVQEYGVIRSAADAGVGESVIKDAGTAELARLVSFSSLLLDRRLPRVVEALSGGSFNVRLVSTSMGANEATACP